MIFRLFLVALVLWASPVQAAITCEATGVQAAQTTDPANVAYTFPGNSNQVTFLTIHDRTETNSVTGVSGGSCTWTLRAGPVDLSTATAIRLWIYEGVNCVAGATTIAVDLGAAGNSHLAAASCWATAALSFVSASPSGAEGSGTSVVTESLTPSATGVVVAGIATSNPVTLTVNSANSDDMTAASSRAHLVRRLESSGSTNVDVTLSGASSFESLVVLYQEGGGGGGSGGRNLSLLGVGQ